MDEYWGLYGIPALLALTRDPLGALDPAMLREGEWQSRQRPTPAMPGLAFRGMRPTYTFPNGWGAIDAYAKIKLRPDEIKLKDIGLRYRMEW